MLTELSENLIMTPENFLRSFLNQWQLDKMYRNRQCRKYFGTSITQKRKEHVSHSSLIIIKVVSHNGMENDTWNSRFRI